MVKTQTTHQYVGNFSLFLCFLVSSVGLTDACRLVSSIVWYVEQFWSKNCIFLNKHHMSSVEISFCLTLFFFAHGSLWSLSASTGCNSLSVKLQNSYVGWEVLTRADARSRRNTKLIFTFPFCVTSLSAPSRGDHLKRRSSASNPPRASVQEEGKPSESRQPGHGTRQTRRAFKEQEARQNSEKGERQTRSQAKGE